MMRSVFFVLATMVALLATGLATDLVTEVCADSWTEFRGPTGQGHATSKGTLPVQWDDTQNTAWKAPLPGQGWSSPVLYQGRIYLTAAVPVADSAQEDYSLQLLSVDAKAGQILAAVEVFFQDGAAAANIHSKNSHASPTPLIHGDRIYVHFGHQGTACLDLDGQILWRKRIDYPPVHGNGGSPILVDDALIFSCDGAEQPFVVALDCHTGQVLWKTNRPGDATKKFSFSTPLLITVNGQRQVVSPGSDAVCAYDPLNGEEIWRVHYDGYSVIPRPVYGNGLVFIGSGYDVPSVLAIRPDGQGDVTETHVEWSIRKGAPHTPSLLLVGDELYMVSDRGVASCLDAGTGRVHWVQRLGGNYSASPIYADGKIYFQSEQGQGVVIRPGTEFHKLADNDLGERALASYAVGNGALFIRSEQHLFRVGQ